jgi:hypothetical protein
LGLSIARGKRHERADPPRPLALLRSRGERPRGNRTNCHSNEIASSHCLPRGSDYADFQLQQGFAIDEMGSNDQFALQKSRTAHVCFGSKADIASSSRHVRFTPQKRTSVECIGMSALCQKRTLGPFSIN